MNIFTISILIFLFITAVISPVIIISIVDSINAKNKKMLKKSRKKITATIIEIYNDTASITPTMNVVKRIKAETIIENKKYFFISDKLDIDITDKYKIGQSVEILIKNDNPKIYMFLL